MTRTNATILASLLALAGGGAFAVAVAREDAPSPHPAAVAVGANAKALVNTDSDGLAIDGYDPVAYFTYKKPVKGSDKFTAVHKGAVYRFASAEHKAMFEKEPEKYAPQFGGYCGYAASIDRLSPTDPEYWQVIDGRLILQHNQTALDKWNKDLKGNLVKADQNWPRLVEKNGTTMKVLVNADKQGVAVQGFDVVAYFTDGKPVKGDPQYEAVFGGAKYHFASQDHRVLFENDPTKYAPAYGGYCGYGVSIDKLFPVDPQVWQIVDGRLILQHDREVFETFNKNTAQSCAKADANWPGLVKNKGK